MVQTLDTKAAHNGTQGGLTPWTAALIYICKYIHAYTQCGLLKMQSHLKAMHCVYGVNQAGIKGNDADK